MVSPFLSQCLKGAPSRGHPNVKNLLPCPPSLLRRRRPVRRIRAILTNLRQLRTIYSAVPELLALKTLHARQVRSLVKLPLPLVDSGKRSRHCHSGAPRWVFRHVRWNLQCYSPDPATFCDHATLAAANILEHHTSSTPVPPYRRTLPSPLRPSV
jgi:hypothetical protein